MSDDSFVQTGRTMYILSWLIFFALLILFFYYFTQDQESSAQISHGKLMITQNRQGHYEIEGTINQYAVTFMLDTGATFVAIPETLANQMNLKGRYPVKLQTANGEVTGRMTRLEELSFGRFVLKNVAAVIIPAQNDNTVLMGMNVLKKFNLTQKDKQLLITQ